MATRHELEKLKKLLYKNIANSDFINFRKNVDIFQKRFKNILTPNDQIELQKIIRTMNRPRATSYEFFLFLFVLVFILLVFGEIIDLRSENAVFLIQRIRYKS